MGRYSVLCSFMAPLVFIVAGSLPASAQGGATADAMNFIQQMTDKTKACAARGISEQDCVCQSRSEWQDMLVLMQMMQNDPNVDAANRSVLGQGTAKVQGLLGSCR